MAWSIFTNGGGDGAAATWASDLLQALGAPNTPGNQQFIYDWELSEGGGGQYNPLNQGVDPGNSALTSSGNQYGGGAADYVSYAAGIQGAVDFLNMSNYTSVKSALMANNPTAAKEALIQSPWAASHYGYGSAFSNAPLPGQSSSLIGNVGNIENASSSNGSATSANWFTNLFSMGGQEQDLENLFGTAGSPSALTKGFQKVAVRGGLILLGGIVLLIGLMRLSGNNTVSTAVSMVPGGGLVNKAAGK